MNYINTNKRSADRNLLQEVPSIDFLREQVKLCTDRLNIKEKVNKPESWNIMFHQFCDLCDLKYEFPPWSMPSCYGTNKTCGHIQQVNLDKAAINTLYLTALDKMPNSASDNLPLSVAAMFTQYVVYENPIWDLGLQHQIVSNNTDKLFHMEFKRVSRYTTKYICPCGKLLQSWHHQKRINMLPTFQQCDKKNL